MRGGCRIRSSEVLEEEDYANFQGEENQVPESIHTSHSQQTSIVEMAFVSRIVRLPNHQHPDSQNL